ATNLDKPSTRATASSSKSAVTPEQAMRQFEARSARAFAVGLAILCALGVGLVVALGGDPLAQKLHAGTIAATGVTAIADAACKRAVDDFRVWQINVVVYVSIVANATGYYYWGVYSAYFALVTVSAYWFASGVGRSMVSGLVCSILAHSGVGIAVLAGWIE